jgi:23S rRNA pseudouridine1911/1915/1917 synthase
MPIASSKYAFGKFGVNEEGKRALTKFNLVKKYRSGGKVYSLLDIDLKTGRTHQIRVHLSYLRWPLVGDKIYGGDKIDGLKRPFLHAYKIIFKHPISGNNVEIKIDLAKDLNEVLHKYEKY